MGDTGRAQIMPSSAFDCPAAVYSCPSRSLQAASGRICSCASRASPHNHRPCSGPFTSQAYMSSPSSRALTAG